MRRTSFSAVVAIVASVVGCAEDEPNAYTDTSSHQGGAKPAVHEDAGSSSSDDNPDAAMPGDESPDAPMPGTKDAAVDAPEAAFHVTSVAAPSDSCEYSEDGTSFVVQGLYDIAPGGSGGSASCDHPYVLHLRAERRAGPAQAGVVEISRAEVLLTTREHEAFVFTDEPPLPNPFLVTAIASLVPASSSEPARGIVAVEVIPTAYAPYFAGVVGGQMLAEITLVGTTGGNIDVEGAPFAFPIEICDGCLTACETELSAEEREQATVGQCADNAGADGRLCIDDDC